ncbi:MAG: hypothetical protein E7037_06605 [Verrucomicrobia bacterium]|nr:hypothetical protein [Verrucomicrobiota bacterium]
MNKFKLLILVATAFISGFLAGRFSETESARDDSQELVNGFAYLDALEKAADLIEEKVFCDGRLRQWELNDYSALASTIREGWVNSLEAELRLSKDFHLIEEEFEKEYWAWKKVFEKEMSKRSVYAGGSAAGMDLALRRDRLLQDRAIDLKTKWISRLPVPHFEKPEPPTKEELEAWRKLEEEAQNENWCEEESWNG